MRYSRREFGRISLAVLGALALPGSRGRAFGAPRPDAKTFFDWKPARENVQVAFQAGGNSMVLAGKDGALLVDCKNAGFGAVLRHEAEAICSPIRFVVNTHHHGDHTGGNHAYARDLPVISQDRCKTRVLGQLERYISQVKEGILNLSGAPAGAPTEMVKAEIKKLHDRLADLKAEEWAPTETFASDKKLEVSGHSIVLRHVGAGHTDNDVFVVVPDLNVVHAGDLLFHKNHPFIDREGGASTTGWMESVKKVIEACDAKTVVVPGHGELTDVGGLKAQIEYFERVREAVGKAIKDGKSADDIAKIELEQYKDYGLAQIRPRVMRAVYEEMSGK